VDVPKLKAVKLSADARTKAANDRTAASERAQEQSWSITSVTAEAKHIAKMARAAEPVSADDPTRVVVPDTPSHRADAGMAWGTLIHGLLEHAMRHEHATRDELRRLAMWLTVEEPQLRVVIDEALDTVERVRKTTEWKAAQASEHSAEVPFMFDDGRGLLAGVIDLMNCDGEAWTITDYKTDVSTDVEKQNAYAYQLESYKKALSACGLTVADAKIAPVRQD
jgi:ATP-dependent exoDNAse (exonuclease V) beta subunit